MNINEEYIKSIAHQRRIRQQAAAFIHRGKEAGIPERFLRTKKQVFQDLLCDKYHEDVSAIANIVFDNSNRLLTIPNILIDGGNSTSRTQAGCTILFRMIACDKNGIYNRCDRLSHKLEDLKSDGTMSRNAYVDDLQQYDSMFIGEINARSFNEYLSSGSFMDELLGYRSDNMLPTIFSFSKPLGKVNGIDTGQKTIEAKIAGDMLASLAVREYASLDKKINPTNNIFRIRVKNV